METKHTQGQWDFAVGKEKIFIMSENETIMVAQLDAKMVQAEANAQLITHAPELLQMVYDLKECIKRLTEDNNLSQFDKDKEAEWIGEAHELLIKANGGAYWKNANEK